MSHVEWIFSLSVFFSVAVAECTECDPSEFEIDPCTSESDRHCLHAAHPVLRASMDAIATSVDGLNVTTSGNVFLEDLHDTRNLETTYYVTDMTQASDFYWDRESGLRVNIGIHDVHLIPEYVDVDHESDNKYTLKKPNNNVDKTRYQRILDDYCSHPIPDYYNIMLEISRNRTTAARRVVCQAGDRARQRDCPPQFVDGDIYWQRSLNEDCSKAPEKRVEQLQPATNSIICLTNSNLLSAIFNQESAEERPFKLPSKKCSSSERQCSLCLAQCAAAAAAAAASVDDYSKNCCEVNCYARADCKYSFNRECAMASSECATGDVYRYTIEAVFQSIERSFRCHIQHQPLSVLYELFFFVQIPSLGFETSKVYRSVYARNRTYQRHGEYTAEYLTVEHSTELDLEQDFILRGHEEKNSKLDFFLQPVSRGVNDDNKDGKIAIQPIGHSGNDWMVSVEFDRPFDYSTSTWVSRDDCDKDVRKLRPVADSQTGLPVSLMILKTAERFRYFLKTFDKSPFFRFTVPANKSILPYHFRDSGFVLLINKSLTAELNSSIDNMTWQIRVKGKMTGCPAYLGVTVNNPLDVEELCRYDLLILCPTEFNISIDIPKHHFLSSPVTFEIRLQDVEKNYSVFLTNFIITSSTYTAAGRVMDRSTEEKSLSTVVCGVLTSTVLTLVVFFGFYLHIEFLKKRSWSGRHLRNSKSCWSRSSMLGFRTTIVGSFVVVRVVYGLTFTFSVLLWIFLVLTKSDFLCLVNLEAFEAEQKNASVHLFLETERSSQAELFRLYELMNGQLLSCQHYIGHLISDMSSAVTNGQQTPWSVARSFSISSLVYERTVGKMDYYKTQIVAFTEQYRSGVSTLLLPSMKRYKTYLRSVFGGNSWFSFPLHLFNSSRQSLRGKSSTSNASAGEFSFLPEFGLFLEIEDIEDVSLWLIQFFTRFNSTLPSMPLFPRVALNASHCGSDVGFSVAFPYLVPGSSLHLFNTFRFFASDSLVNDDSDLISGRLENDIFTPYFANTGGLSETLEAAKLDAFPSSPLPLGTLTASCLWAVCLLLDLLLLTYRASHVLTAVRRIRSYLSYDAKGLYSSFKTVYQCSNGKVPLVDDCMHTFRDDNIQPSQQLNDDAVPATAKFLPAFAHGKAFSDDIDLATDNKTSRDPLVAVLVVFITSKMLPKILIALALVTLFHSFADKAWKILCPEMLHSSGFISRYILPVTVNSRLAEIFLADQSAHYYNATTAIFQNQLLVDLNNIQSLLTVFNFEQKHLLEMYSSEACSILGSRSSSNASCDLAPSFHKVSLPILPCNFLFIQPKIPTEYMATERRRQLLDAFEPFQRSVDNILRTSEFLFLVLLLVTVFVNLSTWTLFRWLDVHRSESASFCDVSGGGVCLQTLSSCGGANSRSATDDRPVTSSLAEYQPANTQDCCSSCEPEVHYTELLSPTLINLSSSSPSSTDPVPLQLRSWGRLTDVGYSETNV